MKPLTCKQGQACSSSTKSANLPEMQTLELEGLCGKEKTK